MGGFTDWTEQVVESNSPVQYRKKVTDAESASMWQSLSYGANYKAAYCLSVCPAGEDVIGPYQPEQGRTLGGIRQTPERESGDCLRSQEFRRTGPRCQTIP